MTDLTTLDAAELAGKIHSREVSSVEVTQADLYRIAAVDTQYHAFRHVAGEQSLQAVAAVDNSVLTVAMRSGGAGWTARAGS